MGRSELFSTRIYWMRSGRQENRTPAAITQNALAERRYEPTLAYLPEECVSVFIAVCTGIEPVSLHRQCNILNQ